MVYPGHVRNGIIVLDKDERIPDGMSVSVEVVAEATENPEGDPPSLLERLRAVVGTAEGLPEDAAPSVDHYLYGHSQR